MNGLLDRVPAMKAPPGVISDLTSSYNDLLAVSIFAWSICALAMVSSTVLRSFTRKYIIKKFEASDYIPVVACLGSLAYIAMCITNTWIGAGKHTWNVSAAKALELSYWAMITAAVYAAAIVFAKLSVIMPLMSTFTPNRRTWLYWTFLTLACTIVMFWLAGLFAVLFACVPREKIWNPLVPGTCIDQHAVYLVSSAFNIVTDLFIIILPLFAIWHLRMAIRYKIGVSMMFLVSTFALIASILRLYYTYLLVNTQDFAYVEAQLGLWTIAEMASLICCACMPVTPRFYKWIRRNRVDTMNARKSEYIEFAGSKGQIQRADQNGNKKYAVDIEMETLVERDRR